MLKRDRSSFSYLRQCTSFLLRKSLWAHRIIRTSAERLTLCYFSSGVPRKTAEEKEFAKFSVFEDPDNYYSTFNFHYPTEPFDRLSALTEFNTLLGEQAIKDVIADCVTKRRGK